MPAISSACCRTARNSACSNSASPIRREKRPPGWTVGRRTARRGSCNAPSAALNSSGRQLELREYRNQDPKGGGGDDDPAFAGAEGYHEHVEHGREQEKRCRRSE